MTGLFRVISSELFPQSCFFMSCIGKTGTGFFDVTMCSSKKHGIHPLLTEPKKHEVNARRKHRLKEVIMMKKQMTISALILAAAVTGAVALCIGSPAPAANQAKALSEEELAAKYPLEAVRQHAVKAAQEMDLPDDRVYGIVTYGGEDHLMVAEEHKEEDHYGVEYIHTLIDTDGVDGYEPEPVDMYFECPVCKSYSSAIIYVDDSSTGRVFWCKCEEPWVIGLTISEDNIR